MGETRGEEVLSLTRFELCDHLLFVNLPYDNAGLLTFLLEEEIDWTYLESLLDFQAEKPLPASGTEALESPPLSPGQP